MLKMRKISAILGMLFVLIGLTACGGQKPAQPETPATASPTPTPIPATATSLPPTATPLPAPTEPPEPVNLSALQPALYDAAKAGDTDTVRNLLEQGVNPQAPNALIPPLNIAADNGHLEIVQLLLDHGADIAVLDLRGYSPLSLAARAAHVEVAQALGATE